MYRNHFSQITASEREAVLGCYRSRASPGEGLRDVATQRLANLEPVLGW